VERFGISRKTFNLMEQRWQPGSNILWSPDNNKGKRGVKAYTARLALRGSPDCMGACQTLFKNMALFGVHIP
jgi:hypothetical protein